MNSDLYDEELVMVIDDSGFQIKCEKYVAPAVYYTVTFDSNGAETPSFIQSVKKRSTDKDPGAIIREGYLFTGWFTEAECTNLYDFSTPVTFDITLYAGWEEVVNKDGVVIFKTEVGVAPEEQKVVAGEFAKDPGAPSEVPDGYKFVGWYYNDEPFDFGNTPIYDVIVLAARWDKADDKVFEEEIPEGKE